MNDSNQRRVAVCPGSYDPVTCGHLDILTRTSRVFDRVVVGVVGQSIRKSTTLFTAEERKAFLERALADVDSTSVEVRGTNLLVEFARQWATAIVKGLRAISDFEYEFEMNQLNRKLAADIESVYIFASAEYSFLSSTGSRRWRPSARTSGDLVPDEVASALIERLRR